MERTYALAIVPFAWLMIGADGSCNPWAGWSNPPPAQTPAPAQPYCNADPPVGCAAGVPRGESVTAGRAFVLVLVALATGVAVGRVLPRGIPPVAGSPSSVPSVAAAPDGACRAVRAELATAKAQLGVCMAYAGAREARASEEAPRAAPHGMDALLAEMSKARVRRENARELVYVEYRDGRVRSYLPEEWPPEGGIEGGRVIMRKLPDGTWEEYDPVPQIVEMAGPPGADGLVTLPDGKRVRWVFTDAGSP